LAVGASPFADAMSECTTLEWVAGTVPTSDRVKAIFGGAACCHNRAAETTTASMQAPPANTQCDFTRRLAAWTGATSAGLNLNVLRRSAIA
jgi:hypothetical protein